MISCTEFIPLYSEFFKFLEQKGGEGAVMDYWIHLSDTSIGDKTNPNSLAYNCEKYGGYEGARAYWNHTLTEEACDLYMICNPVKKYTYSVMRHCPSKGMLNSLKHIEPYHNYCEHCNVIYSRILKDYDIEYEMDHSMIDKAMCTELYYEKGKRPDFDYTKPTEDCIVIDMKSEDNKYLHRDFHLISDHAIKYCGDKYGKDWAVDFLTNFVINFYSPQIAEFKAKGLVALKEWIEKLYEIEEATELLHTNLSDNTLEVTIDKSPVIEYMHTLNQEPSEYYIEQTRTLYATIAKESGFAFELCYYNADGGTKFVFKN